MPARNPTRLRWGHRVDPTFYLWFVLLLGMLALAIVCAVALYPLVRW